MSHIGEVVDKMTKESNGKFYEWLDTCFYDFDMNSAGDKTNFYNLYKNYKFIHYTSLAGFYAMLGKFIESKSEKRIRIFPTHLRYLNDSREYMEGYEALKKISINGKRRFATLQPSDEIYTVSFCGDPDLLSQWKFYGKDSGVAIEFDFLNGIEAKCNFEWGDGMECSTFPHPVIYDNYRNRLKTLYEAFQSNDDEMIFSLLIPYCKNKAFIEEKESRIVFRSESTKINYRVIENKAVPQFECYVSYIKEYICKKPPIKNIIVGPGQNQIIVFNGIIHALQDDKSKIKFFDENECRKKRFTNHKNNKPELFIVEQNNKKYVTFKTDTDITIQLSPTPFRP